MRVADRAVVLTNITRFLYILFLAGSLVAAQYYQISPTSQVNKSNYGIALNLLAGCDYSTPPPNPTSDVYFYTRGSSFVAGNPCLGGPKSITASADLPVSIVPGSLFSSYSAHVDPLKVYNPGSLLLKNIGYSPSVDGSVSGSFSSNSYIFNYPLALPQHDLWTWAANFADMSQIPSSSTSATVLGYIFEFGGIYSYSYTVNAILDSVYNANIPFNYITGGTYNSPLYNQFETPIYPYLLYNYSLGVNALQSYSNPSLRNLSYDVFGPWSYYTPHNSIDPFPIDITSLLLANYTPDGSNWNLTAMTRNGLGVDFSSSSEGLGNIYGSSTAQSTSSACFAFYDPYFSPFSAVTSTPTNYGDAFFASVLIGLGAHVDYGGATTGPEDLAVWRRQYGNSLDFLEAWSRKETGENFFLSYWNPFNSGDTTTGSGNTPGSCNFLNTEAQVYPDASIGIAETVRNLKDPLYESIVTGLKNDYSPNWYVTHTQPREALCMWVSGHGTYSCPYVNVIAELVNEPTETSRLWQNSNTCPGGAFSPPQSNVPQKCLQGTPSESASTGTSTTFSQLAMPDPISIAAMPNDYIYVLYYNNTNSHYYIAVLRMYPHGYYNASIVPFPNSLVTCSPNDAASCTNAWDKVWNQYFNSVALVQNSSLYYVKNFDLNKLEKSIPQSVENSKGLEPLHQDFIPYNISVNSAGELFIVGYTTDDHYRVIEKITNTLEGGSLSITFNSFTKNQLPFSTEIAASLGDVYLTTPIALTRHQGYYSISSLDPTNQGYISVLDANTLAYIYSIPLIYAKGEPAPNPTGGTQYYDYTTLNIAAYLSYPIRGLYHDPITWISPTGSVDDLDKNLYHHPLGIAFVNGYLYVLDDWVGEISQAQFNILSLREINTTGLNVPVNPTQINDMWSINYCAPAQPPAGSSIRNQQCLSSPPPASACNSGCYPTAEIWSSVLSWVGSCFDKYKYECVSSGTQSSEYASLSSVNYFSGNAYPPYGIVLSANITSDNSDYPPESFCSSSLCTYYPGSMPPGYTGNLVPTGPPLRADLPFGGVYATHYTINEDMGFSVNENDTASIYFPSQTESDPLFNSYSELLIMRTNVENYTKLFNTSQQPYICYYNVTDPAPPSACIRYRGLVNISGPIYMVTNPFRNLESLGSARIYALANELYSIFTGGSGSPGSTASSTLGTQCINKLRHGNPCGGLTSQQLRSIQNLYSTPPSQSGSGFSAAPQPYILNSNISGYIIVPFKYTYTLKQRWFNYQLVQCLLPWGTCLPSLPESSSSETDLAYWYGTTQSSKSNSVSANVEGGSTYIQYDTLNSSLYVPYLSDIWGFLSPELLFHIFNNRVFGMIYANETFNAQTNAQAVINATQRLQYGINKRMVGGEVYQNISSYIITPQLYGALSVFNRMFPGHNPIAEQIRNNFTFNQSNSTPPYFGNVNLFDWYLATIHSSPLDLILNGSKYTVPKGTFWATGYHRFIYVFQDRFNNTVYMPLDADIANITTINLNVDSKVSDSNANQTTLIINGTAGFYRPVFANNNFVPLQGNLIYLYYDKNLNYIGQNANIGTITAVPSPESCNAIADQICAYGNVIQPGSLPPGCQIQQYSCTLSNPVYTGLQDNANTITYAPQYNSLGPGNCSPPPNSLLQVAPLICNIYGTDGAHTIPQRCTNTQSAAQQYCVPIFSNGTGICTSQVGLIGIVKTDQNGNFMLSTTACGYGSATITAQYYGYPSPQPLMAHQAPLGLSANPSYASGDASFEVVNYTWTPDTAVYSAEIGLFELSYGDISIYAFAVLLAAVIAISILLEVRRRSIFNKRKKSRGKGSA